MIVVAATQNKNKIKEIDAITSQYGFKIISLADAGYGDLIVNEDGDTFEANSLIKAKTIWEVSGLPSIADDSGFEVDALSGMPGIRSARFAGEHADDRENNEKLLRLMEKVGEEERGARFVCVITMILGVDKIIRARGECKGKVLKTSRGTGGFGYDPLFVPEGYTVTFGEMPSQEKNRISHRAKALELLKERLNEQGGFIG